MTPHITAQEPIEVAAACETAIRVLRATRNDAIRAAHGSGSSLMEISRRTGLARAAVTRAASGEADQ